MKKYLNQDTLLLCIAFVLAFYTVSYPIVEYPHVVDKGPSWLGLDVSWEMTLNYALSKNWVWGKDIIYTYGPLGFLGTRAGFGISKWAFLAFDVFFVANMFCMFRDFLRASTNKWLATVILFAFTIVMESSHRTDISWVITLFSFYWMYNSYKEAKYGYFLLACINITLGFYLKLNAGLVGIIFLLGHLVNLYVFKKTDVKKIGVVLLSLTCMLGFGAYALHVSLAGYLKGAIEIIKGYNSIMFIDQDVYSVQENNVALLFYIMLGFIVVYIIALAKERKFSEIYYSLLVFAYMFLLGKQARLRNDFIHYFEFFSYIPVVFLMGNFLHLFRKNQKPILAFILVFTMLSLIYTSERPKRSINEAISRRYSLDSSWFRLKHYSDVYFLKNKDKRFIPTHVLSRIGKHSVDIFPWDSEYLIENGLNYQPRPVFQSFSAYTDHLEQINYKKYLNKAPDYIIYDYESIDDRYPYNDDLLVNFFICKNYSFVDSFTSNGRWRAVLERKPFAQPLKIVEQGAQLYKINEDIPVEKAKMIKMQFGLNNVGKLQSFLYREPVLNLKMTRANGYSVTYRVSREMLKAGIMVDRWVNGSEDYVKYLTDRDLLDAFKSVRVVADSDFYKPDIKVEYYDVE
ncbi:MAG: hypothetical protein JST70_08530 [Bacteroidetes bacterium]|nr:hypothetical protein [Bacteroidota bacterium]